MPFFPCDNNHPMSFDQDRVVRELRNVRRQWRERQNRLNESGGRHLPSPAVIDQAVKQLIGALFPMRLGPDELLQEHEDFYVGYTIGMALNALLSQVKRELQHVSSAPLTADDLHEKASCIVQQFSQRLPTIRALLDTDVLAAYSGDPAARSVDEVLLCYPGIQAMIYHRIAHEFFKWGACLTARIIAEIAHSATGIDIHPGAQIGSGCFIDHGTGVVIGETCIIGRHVRIYQAVTLGAKSFTADEDGNLHKGLPRHPIVEDNVVIYAGATILGRITIGKGAVIGGNTWVTESVAPGEFVRIASVRQMR